MDDVQLHTLYQLYTQRTPYSPLAIPASVFPTAKIACRPDIQQKFERFFEADQNGCGGKDWRVAFWKRVLRIIEIGIKEYGDENDELAVSDGIIEGFSKILGDTTSSDSCIWRSYIFKVKSEEICLKIMDDNAIISRGTTGLSTWQASLHLANHLLANPSLIHRSVLELGAGTGVVSLVAAKIAKAYSTGTTIYATDKDENVLERGKVNATENGEAGSVTMLELDWEEYILDEQDNRFDDLDLILGADIVFDTRIIPALVKTLQRLLRPNNKAIISCEIRNEETWATFERRLATERLDFRPLDTMMILENSILTLERLREMLGGIDLKGLHSGKIVTVEITVSE